MTNHKHFEDLLKRLSPSDLAWIDENWEKPVQLFTFVDTKTGETLHIKVTELADAIHKNEVPHASLMIAFPQDLYDQIVTKQGIERDHLDEISLDDAVYKPAIIVESDDPNGPSGLSHIIVDGNHKLVKAFELGLRRHPVYIVRIENIDAFVAKMPPLVSELMKSLTIENLQIGQVIAEIREGRTALT